MKLAFSTAACPEWTWRQAIAKATEFGYHGIEWRLDDASQLPPALPAGLAGEIGAASAEAGLGVPALDGSQEVPIEPRPDLDDIRRGLETARLLNAERLVVAPGPYAETISDRQATTWLREALRSLHDDVRSTGVALALDLRRTLPWDRVALRAKTCSAFLTDALWGLDLPGIGVQWDLGESYLEGERADQVWDNVWRWFSYLQLRDMARDGSGWRNVALGDGDLPVAFAIKYVGGPRYTGWVSFNWDRLADPALAPAEEALPGFASAMKQYV